MEILRMFVDPLEDLFDRLLVFFLLKNSLPSRPLRHRAQFENIINEYPAFYQDRNFQR